MGESTDTRATLQFDRRLRLEEFHGADITSHAGLQTCRELDDAWLRQHR